MALFSTPKRTNVDENELLKKVKNSKKSQPTLKLGKDSLLTVINNIKNVVESRLGKYKDRYRLVNTKEELDAYIDKIIAKGFCSLDTETTGVNPYRDKLVGASLHTPGEKAIYIPIRHISYITNEPVSSNIPIEDFIACFKRLSDNGVKVIYQNGKFDFKFMFNDFGLSIPVWWDTLLVSRALNQKEPAGLKERHAKYVEHSDEFSKFGDLFSNIPFQYIPVNYAYIYGAKDAEMTTELFQYQMKELETQPRVKWMLENIEFPCVKATIALEQNGVLIDKKYAQDLHVKYQKLLEDAEKNCYSELEKFKMQIESYKAHHINCKLGSPINLGSPTQLSILFYDIMLLPSVSKKEPRGTGEDIIEKWSNSKDANCHKYKTFFDSLLAYREYKKLMTTYIDALPEQTESDGRIHCSFNQYGADTGRFSSSEPNLQNIPSHNKDIRPMFTVPEGYCLIGSDFSQQEVRLMAVMSKDEHMIEAYKQGRDIYAWVASMIYKVPYEECKEFRPDGSTNKEGKERRNNTKAIVLGINYSRSVKTIAESLNISEKEAQEIYDTFLNTFPRIKEFIKSTQEKVRKYGFTETMFGRRRYIPDMQLEEIEVIRTKPNQAELDPTNFESDVNLDYSISNSEKEYWIKRIKKSFGFMQKQKIIDEAKSEGIEIRDNRLKIQEAERQCVNSVIQGTAGDQTKLALISLVNNEELNRLGFKVNLTVHDEILGECPIENAKRCAEILSYTMAHSLDKYCDMPFKCDAEFSKSWYGEKLEL